MRKKKKLDNIVSVDESTRESTLVKCARFLYTKGPSASQEYLASKSINGMPVSNGQALYTKSNMASKIPSLTKM